MSPRECETCVQPMSITRYLAGLREAAPDAAGQVVRAVADNPGQVVLICAASMVAARAAGNLVRPRTMTEALALCLVLSAGMGKLTTVALERGWINFRVRGADGELISLRNA